MVILAAKKSYYLEYFLIVKLSLKNVKGEFGHLKISSSKNTVFDPFFLKKCVKTHLKSCQPI